MIEGAGDVTRSQGGFKNPFPTVVAGGSAHFLADQGGFENNKMPCRSNVHNQSPTVAAGGSAHFWGKLKTAAQIECKKRKKKKYMGDRRFGERGDGGCGERGDRRFGERGDGGCGEQGD